MDDSNKQFTKVPPNKHHRQSIRLKEFDYRQNGAYFVTICSHNKECLFGNVMNEEMQLNDAGRMVQAVWNEISSHYPGIETDTFIVMPNHIHGIIVLAGVTPGVLIPDNSPINDTTVQQQPLSLPDIVQRFKTMTIKQYSDGVKQFHWKPYCDRLWQRNYYEHIIRNHESLNVIREYIINNPMQWEFDRENPIPNTNPTSKYLPTESWRV